MKPEKIVIKLSKYYVRKLEKYLDSKLYQSENYFLETTIAQILFPKFNSIFNRVNDYYVIIHWEPYISIATPLSGFIIFASANTIKAKRYNPLIKN